MKEFDLMSILTVLHLYPITIQKKVLYKILENNGIKLNRKEIDEMEERYTREITEKDQYYIKNLDMLKRLISNTQITKETIIADIESMKNAIKNAKKIEHGTDR